MNRARSNANFRIRISPPKAYFILVTSSAVQYDQKIYGKFTFFEISEHCTTDRLRMLRPKIYMITSICTPGLYKRLLI